MNIPISVEQSELLPIFGAALCLLGIAICLLAFVGKFLIVGKYSDLPKNRQIILGFLGLLVSLEGLYLLLFEKSSVAPNSPPKEITKTDAFNRLFDDGWEVSPYSTKKKYPCYKYQGKWELDGKKKYRLKAIGHYDSQKYIYYVPYSVTAYMWCQRSEDNKKEGYRLEGIELLKNDVYISNNKNIESNKDLLDENKIGRISGLFLDKIIFDSSGKPIVRNGTRIGRHHYDLSECTKISDKKKREYMKTAVDYIADLNPKGCDVIEIPRDPGEELEKDKYVIQFDCNHTYEKDEQEYKEEYKKRLVFRGHV